MVNNQWTGKPIQNPCVPWGSQFESSIIIWRMFHGCDPPLKHDLLLSSHQPPLGDLYCSVVHFLSPHFLSSATHLSLSIPKPHICTNPSQLSWLCHLSFQVSRGEIDWNFLSSPSWHITVSGSCFHDAADFLVLLLVSCLPFMWVSFYSSTCS